MNTKRELFLYFYTLFSQSSSKLLYLDQNFDIFQIYDDRKNFDFLNKLKLTENQFQNLNKFRKLSVEDLLSWLKKFNQDFVTILDENYPQNLKFTKNPPPIIFFRGEFPSSKDDFSITIVGTRKLTFYGAEATKKFSKELVNSGFSVISGLAIGIDTEAHISTLNEGGRTLAVLGGGIDEKSIFPKENLKLAEKIIDSGGAVISEYLPETEIQKFNFPARDRIMAGISKGVLVIECPEKSGALITASVALNEGREVFAVPGDIFKQNSLGTNNLIKSGGAKLVTNVQDILDEFGLKKENAKSFVDAKSNLPKSKAEILILEMLQFSDLHIDEIVRKSELSQAEILQTITMMEITGAIKHIGGMVYRKL